MSNQIKFSSLKKRKTHEKLSWLELIVDLKNSVIPAIWKQVVLSMSFGAIVTFLYHNGFQVNQPILASLIPGVVLGLLLVFRTNTAYDRYWEGCKLWYDFSQAGIILSRNIWAIIQPSNYRENAEKNAHLRLVIVLMFAIKLHLRKETIDGEIQVMLTKEKYLQLKQVAHPTLRIINWLAEYFRVIYYEREQIPYRLFVELNRSLDQILMLLGSAERILNTPIPRPYSIHLKHLLLLYCFALPFQLVEPLGWWSIPAVGIVSFSLLGIEDIGLEIENPFGYDRNDLPLDKFCQELKEEIEREYINFSEERQLY